MSATPPSTTPPNTSQIAKGLFDGLMKTAQTLIDSLGPEEMKVCGPQVIAFFQWLQANPSAAFSPVVFGPKVMALKMGLMAAQTTVGTDLVQQASGEMVTLFQAIVNQVNGKG